MISPSVTHEKGRPLAIDLFCGLGGWTEGLLAEGYNVVGFDIERHAYGDHAYPAQLVIQDVLTLHGQQFKDAALIVASPPCQKYSYMAMPWSRAKQIEADYKSGVRDVKQLTALFDACFRIQREASEAKGEYIPLVVENVRGAQKWVGQSRYHFGSFHLWGDVPALMPITAKHVKVPTMGAGWYPPDHPKHVPGLAFNGHADRMVREGIKGHGGAWFKDADTADGKYAGGNFRNGIDGVKCGGPVGDDWFAKHNRPEFLEAVKGADGGWFNDNKRKGNGEPTGRLSQSGSKSPARKAASALIAKIPLTLSRHIAAAWYPERAA